MKSQPLRARGRRAGRVAMPQANWFGRLIAQVRRTLGGPIRPSTPDLTCEQVVGFVAWWLWRTIYLGKLPRFEKKLRVALDRTLDLLFSKDIVQFMTFHAPTISHAEADERPAMRESRTGEAAMR